jgi:2-haloacid dehalogenase
MRPPALDMFGTLADPSGLAEPLGEHVVDAERIAARWRLHQLEISWLLSLMECYEDWGAVTRHALDVALAESGDELSPEQKETLLETARIPGLFSEVSEALEQLQEREFELAVFSNGTGEQLAAILEAASISRRFSHVISVDEVGVFKPSPAVYRHAASALGHTVGEVWLVTANPFDAAGGKMAGMRVAKIERKPSFRYPFAPDPDVVVADLAELARTLPARRGA